MGSRWRELDKSITETGQLCDLSLVTAAWRCHLVAPEDMAMSGIWLKTQGKVQKPSSTRETKGNKRKAGIKAAAASASHRAEEKLPQKGWVQESARTRSLQKSALWGKSDFCLRGGK